MEIKTVCKNLQLKQKKSPSSIFSARIYAKIQNLPILVYLLMNYDAKQFSSFSSVQHFYQSVDKSQ